MYAYYQKASVFSRGRYCIYLKLNYCKNSNFFVDKITCIIDSINNRVPVYLTFKTDVKDPII